MKLAFILIAFLCSFASPSISNEHVRSHLMESIQTTVYITKTGTKYHAEDCRSLSKSKISISRKEAITNGYDACKVCKP
jgi:hypothetical protein